MPPTTTDLNTLSDTALRAALAAGEALLTCKQGQLEVDRLLAHDIKLAADRKAEEAILSILQTQDPDAEIHTEEAGDFSGSGDHIWYIDPLDGTMNFFHGQHHYCTCVGCFSTGHHPSGLGIPISGVVFAPDDDELFHAQPGQGAQCNGERIRCSGVDRLRDAILGTSFGSEPDTMQFMTDLMGELLPSTRKLRILGSCGLDICQVAAGRLSALYQRNIRVWDFAAATPILTEAGGILEIEPGSRPGTWNVLASAPGIFQELHDILNRRRSSGPVFRYG